VRATTVESAEGALRNRLMSIGRLGKSTAAPLAVGATIAAAVVDWHGGVRRELAWLVLALVWLTAALGIRRARVLRGGERVRMHAVALALTLAAEVIVVASTLHILVGWPPRLLPIAAAATLAVPTAAVVRVPRRFETRVTRLVAPAIAVAGLTTLVAAIYLLVVVGLGRPPTREERTLLVLSIAAACVSALLYVPARRRLTDFSNGLVHGARQSPDELLRTFGARLSRAVPLEELLQQLAELLRRGLALDAAEIWTCSAGVLERVVSEPDRGPAAVRLTAAEEAVVARSGVSGPARVATWLPELLADRGEVPVRVAPIADAGELFGLIVAERSPEAEPFDEQANAVLAELARQVGLALRNVRLDSDLQRSLAELRRQAEELRVSRARVVAAADAERRRIERDLHDGAQQHLVALEANLGALDGLIDSDAEQAKAILDELRAAAREAMHDFRDLAHGIYPPLLQDRGLSEALANAARRATISTRLEAAEIGRYEPEIEATVYFCCVEALQNATKHAGESARATIRVRETEDALVLEVADNGSGLDPARTAFGAGLTNMRDRLEAIGGGLRIESTVGRGTRVVGTIPLVETASYDSPVRSRVELPHGTVTFLFTDIEGSTRLLKQLGENYADALAEHQRILRKAFEEYGGHEIDSQGDSFFVAFRRAKDAVTAAVACQRRLRTYAWPEGIGLWVRMGIHTGEPTAAGERYVGLGVHRAARISAAGHGGQVLVSQTTRELLRDDPVRGVVLRDLGEHQLKDLDEPERLYQLVATGLLDEFPPLVSD
jgi:signal transduction histidine kinase